MKATGIVRRFDDLGRIVIPREIRRQLEIKEGQGMEIFTDRDGSIILKKYIPAEEGGITDDNGATDTIQGWDSRTSARIVSGRRKAGVPRENLNNYVIKRLAENLGAYEDLGVTPEQIREMDTLYSELAKEDVAAREKQREKPPHIYGDGYADGVLVYDMYDCPGCGEAYEIDYQKYDYCPKCGQAIDWSGYSEDGRDDG